MNVAIRSRLRITAPVFVLLVFLNLGTTYEVFGLESNDTSTNTTSQIIPSNNTNNTQTFSNNGLNNIPLVINVTKNTNATDTVIDLVVSQVNGSGVNMPVIEKLAKDRIPLLIDVLKNTNASSIAAQYVLNVTKEGLVGNTTGS